MRIIRQKLGIKFDSEAIGIYLCQIRTSLDSSTKKEKNPGGKWKTIKSILEFVSKTANSRPFNILIFPEICLPYRYIKGFNRFIEHKFPDNTVTIVGIEIISVNECINLADSLGIKKLEVMELLKSAHRGQPVNSCLIIAKQGASKCRYFLQIKIAHSKFEGDLDNIKNILLSNYAYYFNSRNINFVVLICSDFFNRPVGKFMKIIDAIDYEILKKGKPLDFIINIQYNPSPDDERFLHSLSRIFDDGYHTHGNLCVIFLNSVFGIIKGGFSKVLFHKDAKLQKTQPVKQIDAPVVGYEFSKKEMLAHYYFDRLPRSWDPKRDVQPMHFECYQMAFK